MTDETSRQKRLSVFLVEKGAPGFSLGVIEEKMGQVPEVYGIKSTFKGYRPELKIKVNKDRASLYDI